MKSIVPLVALALLLSVEPMAYGQDQSALQGRVKQSRVQRPPTAAMQTKNQDTEKAGISDTTFSNIAPVKAAAVTGAFEGMPLEEPPATPSPPTIIQAPVKPQVEPQAAKPAETTAPTSTASDKEITIRLKRFRALLEMEVVWEAANMANIMQHKGAHVTMLLDMEAVHAVNRHDTMFSEFQLHRGNGSSSEKLESVQLLIRQFLDAGGEVLVSERWAHYYGMANGSSMIPGAKLVSDDEIADHLLNSKNILDY